MENCERQVRTWIATQRMQEIAEIVSGISAGSITLLSLVKTLGEYLTSEDGEIRGKGVALLSTVLERCPKEKINAKSTAILMTFYYDKLDDIDTIIPALNGILALSSLPSFTDSDASDTFKALVSHVKMKAHVQSTRYVIFKIIDMIMARHRGALQKLGRDFIKGYISLAEGEKDPRNLMLAFAIGRVLLIEFDITNHVEDLFDIYFCYFPITFKPPPGDPYGISTDDLKLALLSCLNATPLFSLLAIPLFLEKLSASSVNVKRDTLRALADCLPIYGISAARKFSISLWEGFKVEIFQPIDSETEKLALEAAQVLVRTLHPLELSPNGDLGGLVVEICTDCIKILQEPGKSQAQQAIKVLAAFIGTTAKVAQYALSITIPHLIRLFLSPDEASHRAALLVELTAMLSAVRDNLALFDSQPLESYKDQVLGVFTSGLKLPAARKASLNGTLQLILIPKLLTDEELGFVLHNVNELFESSADADDLRGPILNLLSTISNSSPKLVEETTLPLLFSSLPDSAPPRSAESGRSAYQRTLKSLSTLCLQPALFETLVIRLTTKLDLVCHTTATGEAIEPSTIECNAAYAHAILITLNNVLDYKVDAKHTDVPKYVDRLVPRLYKTFIDAATRGTSGSIESDIRLISAAGSIIAVIVSALTLERQTSFVNALFENFLQGNVGSITGAAISPSNQFAPLGTNPAEGQRKLVTLFSAPLIVVRREVKLPVDDLSQFLRSTLSWGLDSHSGEHEFYSICHLIASILNKHTEDCTNFIQTELDQIWGGLIENTSVELARRKRAISGWMWVTRALLVRSHERANSNVDRLISLFSNELLSWDAAKAIGELGRTDDSILTRAHGNVIKLFFAQKYSAKILPVILAGYRASSSENTKQTAFLVALTTLIKYLPKSMYAQDLPALMPLLLRGLDLEDVMMRANVIDALTNIAKEDSSDSSVLSDHVTSVVNTLVKNAVPASAVTSARLRISALRCLGILPNAVRYDVLHPHQQPTIRALAKALDDRNREVRRMAVDTRAVWFALSG